MSPTFPHPTPAFPPTSLHKWDYPTAGPAWLELQDEDGNWYYYNQETDEASWDAPADWHQVPGTPVHEHIRKGGGEKPRIKRGISKGGGIKKGGGHVQPQRDDTARTNSDNGVK